MTEVRTTSSTGGEKGTKPERYDLIPVDALASVARLYGVGAKKYAEHNWRKGYEWSKSYAALQRHANAFWNGEDFDPEFEDFPSPHLAGVIFHALTLITFMREQREFDDRFVIPTESDPNEALYKAAMDAIDAANRGVVSKEEARDMILPSRLRPTSGVDYEDSVVAPLEGDGTLYIPAAKQDD